ncbi:hypothetical protein DIE06_12260 [Burkholderia sp. Bp8998]|nr:hypothetical protein DIE06_12260 [Burkholderia sp. Bp8998]
MAGPPSRCRLSGKTVSDCRSRPCQRLRQPFDQRPHAPRLQVDAPYPHFPYRRQDAFARLNPPMPG